jgi:hypothetical protein
MIAIVTTVIALGLALVVAWQWHTMQAMGAALAEALDDRDHATRRADALEVWATLRAHVDRRRT